MTDKKDLEDAASTLDGTRKKNEDATRALNDASRQAADNVGKAQRVEAERDDVQEDYERTLTGVQSYFDKQGNALAGIGANVKALYDQVLMDRRTFLAGMAILGAGAVDRTNLLPTDGSYDPLSGQENNSEQPHEDWDAGGLLGEQGFEPHQAAEGTAQGEYQVIEETIGRGTYQDIFSDIIEDDGRMARRIMDPQAFERYFDGQGSEFWEMNVNYNPDPENNNSTLQVGTFDMEEVGNIENVTEEDISYSEWINVGDDVAYELVQRMDNYE